MDKFTLSSTGGVVKATTSSRTTLFPLTHSLPDLTEFSQLTMDIQDGTSQFELSLGGMEIARFLYLTTTGDISLFINGSANPIDVEKDGVLLLMGTNISSILISNNFGAEISLTYSVANI